MARTELGVAVASILIVAGVLAIPLVAPAPVVAPVPIPHPLITPSSSATPSAADLVGPQCAAYEKLYPTGPSSLLGMSQEQFEVAASNSPLLTTLTKALSGKLNPSVNLVSKVDGAQYTIFAPVDSAFKKLPAAQLTSLGQTTNAKQLTELLEFHIVKGKNQPTGIDGIYPTLEGGMVTVKGSGNSITVDGANVLCGGIQTANATVYLIDTVLTPPAN